MTKREKEQISTTYVVKKVLKKSKQNSWLLQLLQSNIHKH